MFTSDTIADISLETFGVSYSYFFFCIYSKDNFEMVCV